MVEDPSVSPGVPGSSSRTWTAPAGIFFGLFLLYQLNGPFFRVGDAQPNLYLPVQVLTRGTLSYSADEAPFMFLWRLDGVRPRRVQIPSWDDRLEGQAASTLRDAGRLSVIGPKYYLVESVRPGRYVGIYGPGAGLCALPFFALVSLVRPDWRDNSAILGAEAKLFASACVAGSAVFVYLAFLLYLPRRPSILLSLLYGAGTCVWTEPSQALWQQTPAIFFVALGAYLFLRLPGSPRFALACGAAWSCAAFCRPSLALLPVIAVIDALLRNRKAVLPLMLGAAPPAAALAAFNTFYLGSPLRFGQVLTAGRLAAEQQGSSGAWDGNLITGLAGILVSPSRGLLIYSPIFLFSLWGAVRCWRQDAGAPFRALAVAFGALLIVAAQWIQWWGGWSFGYRLISELSPLAMLLLIPVADRALARPTLLSPFGFLAFWSVALQTLGAFGYDSASWNNRSSYRIRAIGAGSPEELTDMETAVRRRQEGSAEILGTVEMDVTLPAYRRRLWSVQDGQLAWLLRPHGLREGYTARQNLAEAAAKERIAQRPSTSQPFR